MAGAVHAISIPEGIDWCDLEISTLEAYHRLLSFHDYQRDEPEPTSCRRELAMLNMIRDVLQARFDNGPHPNELREEDPAVDDGRAKPRPNEHTA